MIVSSAFIFILVMTAWDYCPPKPGHKDISSVLNTQGIHFKNPHRPCTSLKDSYDVSRAIFEPAPKQIKTFFALASIVSPFSATYTDFVFNSHAPPRIVLASFQVPLYQLNCSLRI